MLTLADDVLAGVSLEECLWQVDESSWTVQQRDGDWYGELGAETPDMATPSLAWTMWHPIWWLTTLLAHVHDETPPEPSEVVWPGPGGTLPELRRLWGGWMAFVASHDDEGLAAASTIAFPYDDGRPFVHVAGWASMELTKNLAEMCMQRRLRG